ncbi:hypothetical protein PAPYR_2313 [Paratrimastix pyriformis]|uniref:Uncharacterized protein n=1 Tax=Paratrimastix pyriformis TaxID=342808 RepID=A0ABQ8UQ31_9EUKA|nr:hypothetical protein PAPYR_2313 [Paratrimastix pyriformis]
MGITLPPQELLLALVEASDCPLQTYILLVSLSHDVRKALRGGLQALSLSSHESHFFEDGCSSWVDEAFGNHAQLAFLRTSWTSPVLRGWFRILDHLPGLRELHIDAGDELTADLLTAVGLSCHGLEALHIEGLTRGDLDFGLLRPLAGTLKQLGILDVPASESLDAFIQCLPALEQVSMFMFTTALRPAAHRLTHLTLQNLPDYVDGSGLLGMGLDRLEVIDLSFSFPTPEAIRFLNASRDTLRSLTLAISDDAAMYAALDALPRLARLSLWLPDLDMASFPAGLLDRLEHFTLRLSTSTPSGGSISVASSHLRHLRSLEWLGGQSLKRCCVMPYLSRVGCSFSAHPLALVQLSARAPRLSILNNLRAKSETLDIVDQFSSLTRLVVRLDTAEVSPDRAFTVRFPEHLQSLSLSFVCARPAEGKPTMEACIEAPGLRLLSVSGSLPVAHRLTLRCPALESLELNNLINVLSCPVVGEAAPLRLCLRWCKLMDGADLIAWLDQCGSRLRHVVLSGLSPSCVRAWPRLAAALGQLPRLAVLELAEHFVSNLELASPSLRSLMLSRSWRTDNDDGTETTLRSLVLGCPLLEELQGPFTHQLKRFETGPIRGLRRVGGVREPWDRQLAERFSGVRLDR